MIPDDPWADLMLYRYTSRGKPGLSMRLGKRPTRLLMVRDNHTGKLLDPSEYALFPHWRKESRDGESANVIHFRTWQHTAMTVIFESDPRVVRRQLPVSMPSE